MDANTNNVEQLSSQTSIFSMEDMEIVGLCGKKRSGKDTIGKHYIAKGFTRVAFADPLKNGCIAMFGFSNEQVFGEELKEVVDDYWGYSPREVLQKVGTELFRGYITNWDVLPSIGNNLWIRRLQKEIIDLANKGHRKFVITDIRFDNELEFVDTVKKMGCHAYSIKVNRPAISDNKNNDVNTENLKAHASESHIDSLKCDYDVDNDSTIEELYGKIDQIMKIESNKNMR